MDERDVTAVQSAAYIISVASMVNSAIVTDDAVYVVGDDMTVTVTLKDGQNIPVTGAASHLTAASVTVAGAVLKSGSTWTDNGDGTYSATYAAQISGSRLKASVKLSGWSSAVQSAAYSIAHQNEVDKIEVSRNTSRHYFDKEEGFPTTGFNKANFNIHVFGIPTNQFDWTSNASWVSLQVNNGSVTVTFTGKGTGDKVTIKGIPKNGKGKSVEYSFKLNSWFIHNGSTRGVWSDANTFCSSQSGYSMPTVAQIIQHSNYIPTKAYGIGTLWNEWGQPSMIDNGWSNNMNWTQEQGSAATDHYSVGPGGDIRSNNDNNNNNNNNNNSMMCRQGL